MRFIGNIEKDAQIRAVASGALPSGDAVVVNSDGTVSAVVETPVSQVLGSANTFESAASYHVASAFDSANNKVVIAYRDAGNSNYGTAIVGTVSGTSITFGTPEVFNFATTNLLHAVYDVGTGKTVIVYRDDGNSTYLTCVVATVSGTSISFGSEVVVESVGGSGQSACYDSDTGSVIVTSTNNAYVGTVSGTSISFGSAVEFDTGFSTGVTSAYDISASRVVVCYRDINSAGTANQGTAIVGAVSGTSITFGSPVVFDSSATDYLDSAYHAGAQKIVVAYSDAAGGAAPGNPFLIVGAVSGDTISFGSPTNMTTDWASYANDVTYDATSNKIVAVTSGLGSNGFVVGTVSGTSITIASKAENNPVGVSRLSYVSSTYDSGSGKVVIAYTDNGDSEFGKTKVLQPAYNATNLTAENFVGFAAHTYADTQSALINSTCTVDRNQSGLTAGQTYYVQTDGTLSTTPGDPSVEAGTAISTTSIIVKG